MSIIIKEANLIHRGKYEKDSVNISKSYAY